MNPPYVFVGERRSPTAIRKGWTWHSGHVAAWTLHEALRTCGIDPRACLFFNAFHDDGSPCEAIAQIVAQFPHTPVVALGARASAQLRVLGVEHISMKHPAARGAIRLRERYQAHVRAVLAGKDPDAPTDTLRSASLDSARAGIAALSGLSAPPRVRARVPARRPLPQSHQL